jgi:DNA-binding NarL/FixJ family response regulator
MSKSILVVDDSSSVRKVTRLFLETQIDFEVCGEAVDGLDAIQKARELKPDLILLDLAMPQMNGIEAASVIKGMMPRVLIVLFTLYKDRLGDALVSAVGIDAVLSKPDGGWKLIDCIRSLLQNASAAGAYN